ncbi:MAG: 2-succinyl-5-enolpyruvyl-6-hydroxy-3-cyclohexene-1-carboxylic-acid synthase [Verrucomicrobia bacterium]|nr:2-succinyl-5-enolpyruvyl-6-hydroxy-3-cyclohexene-1-carboxylic-acid synthase [Verrucomicrobiota bacterium]
MQSINRANTNSLWSSVLVECLYRCGLRHVVVSPGSRSAPLTVAFAAHGNIEAIPVLDERSAGFFALGLAKQNHKPVALVCTSGTAAANYFPAVIEASESRVPLLVLTGDRPPELRDCGAGQTIDQIRLYGNYPVFQEEMELPNNAPGDLENLKHKIVAAYKQALSGPVHLNCPFRDPLSPIEDGSTDAVPELGESFFSNVLAPQNVEKKASDPISISRRKGIIICGTEMPEDPESYCAHVSQLSQESDWPVLADGLSPVRNYAHLQKSLVTTYDLLLRNSNLRETLRPEYVIALGPLPTSKELRKWLTESAGEMYHVNRTGKNLDPTGTVVQVLDVPVEDVASCFSFIEQADRDYVDNWSQFHLKAIDALTAAFNAEDAQSFEGSIAWKLPQYLPTGTPVFVASSMPIRDVEYFWPSNGNEFQMYASRGANGIDGTLSTALGVAFENQPSILLTGDLAFLHDSNGLLIRQKFKGHLTIILINNRGGGIFNHLPVSQFEPPFEEFFATPQDVDLKPLVESTGCDYVKLDRLDDLPGMVSTLPKSGIRVIEVETDRHRDSEYRRKIFKEISQSLL